MPQNHPLDEYVEILADIPLLFSPGTQWSYSVATDVIGRLIEIISGQPFDTFLQQRFFDPLGMKDTGFWADDDQADRLAANYAVPSLSPFPLPEGAEGENMALIDDGGPATPFRSRPSLPLRWRRLSINSRRLPSFLPDAAQRRRTRWGQSAQPQRPSTTPPSTIYRVASDLAAMGQPVFSETRYDGVGFGLGFSINIDPAASQVVSSLRVSLRGVAPPQRCFGLIRPKSWPSLA